MLRWDGEGLVVLADISRLDREVSTAGVRRYATGVISYPAASSLSSHTHHTPSSTTFIADLFFFFLLPFPPHNTLPIPTLAGQLAAHLSLFNIKKKGQQWLKTNYILCTFTYPCTYMPNSPHAAGDRVADLCVTSIFCDNPGASLTGDCIDNFPDIMVHSLCLVCFRMPRTVQCA